MGSSEQLGKPNKMLGGRCLATNWKLGVLEACSITKFVKNTCIFNECLQNVGILWHLDTLPVKILLGVTLLWTSFPSRGGLTLLVASCWAPCDGLASHLGGAVRLPIASCWVPCDGLASHPGGSSKAPYCFMLGILWWTSFPSRGEQ